MSGRDRWIIVGGGASGLAAAFFLRCRGVDSVIIERDRALGGRMGTATLGQRSLDFGGKNIGRRYKLFRRFAASLGTHPFEYFGLNSSQVIDGGVVTFEARARWKTFGDITRGVSARDMRRFGHVLLRVMAEEASGYLGSPLSRKLAKRFDDRPASEYFSSEFCRRVLRPMSVRMNGAEPDEVYLGNLGSNVGMILDSYEQLTHGLAPLLADARQQYEVRLEDTAESLILEGGRVVGVLMRDVSGTVTDLRGSGVILATPAGAAAALTERFSPALADQLRAIAYHPVTVIIAEYDRPVFTSTVRALTFEDDAVVSNAGVYGMSDLNVVRYTFSGRAARRCVGIDPTELLQAGEAALSRHVPLDPAWRLRFAARSLSPGLCAYVPHHAQRIDDIHRELETIPGLSLTGDYFQGASIEACFRAASDCVARLSV